MNATKRMLLILCALLIIFSAGCKRTPPPVTSVDITDPAELEQLWQDYLYDSITTVCNGGDFATAAELDPIWVAEFCWFRYVSEQGEDSLEPAGGGSSLRLLPLDTVLTYAERYFGLTTLDVSKVSANEYDASRRAFMFAMDNGPRGTYSGQNSWGVSLTKASRSSDGTVTVVLSDTDRESGRTVRTWTYALKPREDGGLCFASGVQEWINNHLVTITGNYNRVDRITGFDGALSSLTMLGEVDGNMILVSCPGGEDEKSVLMLVRTADLGVVKTLPLAARLNPGDAVLRADGIVIRLADRVESVDTGLTNVTDADLPPAIAALAGKDTFRGYDLSADHKTYVYADGTDVKLLDAANGQAKSILKPAKGRVYASPRFVANGEKVIATLCGYDGATAYALYDLTTGTAEAYPIASGGNSTELIHFDSGLLEVNTYGSDAQGTTGDCQSIYLDFASGTTSVIGLADPGDVDGYPDAAYVGQGGAAFLTHKTDANDWTGTAYLINRVNLKTLTVEPAVISVKATAPRVLGILADGRIVFSYELNPSERGVCITK